MILLVLVETCHLLYMLMSIILDQGLWALLYRSVVANSFGVKKVKLETTGGGGGYVSGEWWRWPSGCLRLWMLEAQLSQSRLVDLMARETDTLAHL